VKDTDTIIVLINIIKRKPKMKNYRTIKIPDCCCSCNWLVISDDENFCSFGFDRDRIELDGIEEGVVLTIEDFVVDFEPVEAFGLCDDFEKAGRDCSAGVIK
jgi:hypothetical protein